MSVERIYQKKTQLEHILLRPDSYIGSVKKVTQVSSLKSTQYALDVILYSFMSTKTIGNYSYVSMRNLCFGLTTCKLWCYCFDRACGCGMRTRVVWCSARSRLFRVSTRSSRKSSVATPFARSFYISRKFLRYICK